jgi:hypothetical protein
MNELKVMDADYEEKCACCGTDATLELDHIIPKAKGGKNTPRNLQLLCKRCNHSKLTGDTCQIDHTLDATKSENNNLSSQALAEDPLVPFSTRLHAGQKALIMKKAKDRGIATGLIIEEILAKSANDEVLELLQTITKKLDSLGTGTMCDPFIPEDGPSAVSPMMRQHSGGIIGSLPERDEHAYRKVDNQTPRPFEMSHLPVLIETPTPEPQPKKWYVRWLAPFTRFL